MQGLCTCLSVAQISWKPFMECTSHLTGLLPRTHRSVVSNLLQFWTCDTSNINKSWINSKHHSVQQWGWGCGFRRIAWGENKRRSLKRAWMYEWGVVWPDQHYYISILQQELVVRFVVASVHLKGYNVDVIIQILNCECQYYISSEGQPLLCEPLTVPDNLCRTACFERAPHYFL